MRARTTTAALLIALVVPVAGSATAHAAPRGVIDVVPHTARNAGHPTAPYVDLGAQTIHDGALTVTINPPLPKPLVEVWATASGYLARDRGSSLYRVSAQGAPTLLMPQVSAGEGSVVVENGGQRVAVLVVGSDPGSRYADVLLTSDGTRVNRLPDGAVGDGLFDFSNGVVAYGAPLKEKIMGQRVTGSQVATWDVSGQAVTLGGRRLRDAQLADLAQGVVARTVNLFFGPVSVLPLVKGARRSWTAPDDFIASFSPDGRLAAGFRFHRNGKGPATLTLRDARTGAAKRTFSVDARKAAGWEDDDSFLVKAYDPVKKKSALMRLSLNGKVERVSDFAKTPDRLLTVS